jgi:hypothetical protein
MRVNLIHHSSNDRQERLKSFVTATPAIGFRWEACSQPCGHHLFEREGASSV